MHNTSPYSRYIDPLGKEVTVDYSLFRRLFSQFFLKLKQSLQNNTVVLVGVFLFAALIRWIPERSIGQYPIGFDTINAYPDYFTTPITLTAAVKHFDLLHWIFFTLYHSFSVDIWITLKAAATVLFALLTTSFFIYGKKAFKLTNSGALLLATIFSLSLASLRLSVDLFRNELGLIFFFWFLSFSLDLQKKQNIILSVLMLFLVFASHQLVTILALLTIISKVLSLLLSSRNSKHHLIFLGILYLILVLTPYLFKTGKLFGIPIWQYYSFADPFNSTPEIITPSIIGSFFITVYGYMLPFVVVGLLVKRNNFLAILTLLLLFIGSSPIIYGGAGFTVWDRWMYFLIFPFSYFTYIAITFITSKIASYFSYELILFLLILALFWQPLLFLNSGKKSTILSIKPINPSVANYFPDSMSQNPLGIFNDPYYNSFFTWLQYQDDKGLPVIMENFLYPLARLHKLTVPVTLASYGQLPPSQKAEFSNAPTTFFSIGSTFGLPNMSEYARFGDIIVFRSND